ncbi:MAG: nuclear transport factor 2 family protein, partial [Acidobacteriota bacterium]
MKRIMSVLALTLVLPALILCQTNGKKADKKGADELSVRQTINELAAALAKNDTAALDRIYDEHYTIVGDNGVLTTKAQRFAAFKSGELNFESISFNDVNVQIYGDTAVATFGVTSKYAPGAKSVGGTFMTTAIFIKRKGRWTEIAAQSTRV